jgi:mRNA interferase MazF
MVVRKGEIYIAELQGEGSVQNGKRPVIITSNDKNNDYAPTVQVIPLTGSTSKKKLPVHVEVGWECGLMKPSIALAEQEQTIDKRMLDNKIGECTKEVLQKIDKAICTQRGMTEPIDLRYIKYLAKSVIMTSNIFKKLNVPTNEVLYYTSSLQELKLRCEEYGINYKTILESTLQNERDEMQCSLKRLVGAI